MRVSNYKCSRPFAQHRITYTTVSRKEYKTNTRKTVCPVMSVTLIVNCIYFFNVTVGKKSTSPHKESETLRCFYNF